MPRLQAPHGKREWRHLWAELTFPVTDFKKRQALLPLKTELAQTDRFFIKDVETLKERLRNGNISRQRADNLYFAALDAAIRRRKKVA